MKAARGVNTSYVKTGQSLEAERSSKPDPGIWLSVEGAYNRLTAKQARAIADQLQRAALWLEKQR